MDNIIEPNESFDFSKLSLAHPVGIQGGAHFTKIENNKKPLYIQTTKSQTRQGFVKTGKKYYCDLMFDKNSEELIHWFENLEEKCQKLIYQKRESWFQNSLEESDIESAFNSLIRVYKSGKYYLLRTNIKSNRLDEPSVKIYNENELSLSMNDVTHETNLISILEIQGIKFTSRNFQIEIELKQVMVLDNEPIFESCLIKSSKNIAPYLENSPVTKEVTLENKENIENTVHSNENDIMNNIDNTDNIPNVDNVDNIGNLNNLDNLVTNTNETNEKKDENILELDIEDLNRETFDEPKEVDIHLDGNEETIQLKKPNQVYFELYKKAREKAKEAKKNAIIAYLEAKNIKKTYMIENVNDSDSDFDAEIDEVSESELEDF